MFDVEKLIFFFYENRFTESRLIVFNLPNIDHSARWIEFHFRDQHEHTYDRFPSIRLSHYKSYSQYRIDLDAQRISNRIPENNNSQAIFNKI